MKLILFGATGRVGLAVAKRALADREIDLTLFVRNKAKLQTLLGAHELARAQVVEGDVRDLDAVESAMKGHQAAINTAGTGRNAPEEYRMIFKGIVEAAAKNLADPKRLWMMAGATILQVPGTNLTFNDLPIFSGLPYRVHTLNYMLLISRGADLDWSLMCPGVLHPAESRLLQKPPHTFMEVAPIWMPRLLQRACGRYIPRLLMALVAIPQMGRFSVTYEEVAEVMVASLAPESALLKKRVGIEKSR